MFSIQCMKNHTAMALHQYSSLYGLTAPQITPLAVQFIIYPIQNITLARVIMVDIHEMSSFVCIITIKYYPRRLVIIICQNDYKNYSDDDRKYFLVRCEDKWWPCSFTHCLCTAQSHKSRQFSDNRLLN